MKVTITLLADGEPQVYDKSVVEAGPAGTFFKVVQELEETTTKAGLIASVVGGRKHTWVPASTIRKVEVVE